MVDHFVSATLAAARVGDNSSFPQNGNLPFDGAKGVFSRHVLLDEWSCAVRMLSDKIENLELALTERHNGFDFKHFLIRLDSKIFR